MTVYLRCEIFSCKRWDVSQCGVGSLQTKPCDSSSRLSATAMADPAHWPRHHWVPQLRNVKVGRVSLAHCLGSPCQPDKWLLRCREAICKVQSVPNMFVPVEPHSCEVNGAVGTPSSKVLGVREAQCRQPLSDDRSMHLILIFVLLDLTRTSTDPSPLQALQTFTRSIIGQSLVAKSRFVLGRATIMTFVMGCLDWVMAVQKSDPHRDRPDR